MNKTSLVTISVLLLILAIGAAYITFRDESELQKQQQTPAATALLPGTDATFTDLTGAPRSLAEHFGKPIVVISWASWCPQCGSELREMATVAQEFAGREVSFFAINRAENQYTAQRFLNTVGTLPGELQIVLDASDHYFTNSTGYAMPEAIVFDSEGSIRFQQRGDVRTEEVKSTLEQLLSE